MITENYIKQCEQAEEIQSECNFTDDDVIYNTRQGKKVNVSGAGRYDIWLPTQEQLQEMMGNQFVSLDGQISRMANMFLISNDQISWKEFWLMYFMHEKYNKIWTGDKWEGVK